MARPSFSVRENDRKVVKIMAAAGCRHRDIARLLGIGPKTMRKYFRMELDLAPVKASEKSSVPTAKMAQPASRPLGFLDSGFLFFEKDPPSVD